MRPAMLQRLLKSPTAERARLAAEAGQRAMQAEHGPIPCAGLRCVPPCWMFQVCKL